MSLAAASRSREGGAFSARTVIALVVAGAFAFSAFVALSAYAPDLRGGEAGGADALSRSAVGYLGLTDLLKALGDPVMVSRDPHVRRDSAGLLVLTPNFDSDPQAVGRMTAAGPVLVVAPKWLTARAPGHPGWAVGLGLAAPEAVAHPLAQRFGPVKMIRDDGPAPARLVGAPVGDLTTGPIEHLQTLADGGGLVPVMRDARGRTVLAATADGEAFLLSDPDLLNTKGVKDLATARAAVALIHSLRRGGGPLVFDVTLNGIVRTRSLLKLAFEPPFLGATLCLAASAVLAALQAMTRFGPPRRQDRAIALGKRALADNSAGLIRLARREPALAGRYLDLTRKAVAEALAARGPGGAPLDAAELTARLDRLAERRGGARRLSALTAEAGTVKDHAGLMRLARGLHEWKLEMIGERR